MAAALFFWAVLGGLVGGFAKSVAWYERAHTWLACVLFGVVGGIVGGIVRKFAGPTDGFDLSSMGLVIVAAAALLCVYSLFAQGGQAAAAAGHERRAA
jgi:uncharacterized membrane protein YeaQ/YmgE (transglycosylase-associated protein family)